MVFASVVLATLAVLLGTGLALWHLRVTETASGRPPAVLGMVHGIVGTAGLATLLLALRGPARGAAAGAASFGTTAAVLFAAALLTGLAVLWLRRKRPAIVMAIHAGFAITGYALLLAWNSLG